MKGYKTLTFNGVLATVMILAEIFAEFGASAEVAFFLDADTMPYVMLGVLFANIALRVMTTSPVLKK